MKLVKITTHYPAYLDSFYAEHPDLANQSYAEQKRAIDFDAFGWADFWSHALSPLGYETLEISINAEQMQRAWARENCFHDCRETDLRAIVVEQVRKYKPDILWFDNSDEKLLAEIKVASPSIKLVLGWTGSAIAASAHWRHVDLALSCAQESVDFLRASGVCAEQLHHGFDPRINERILKRAKMYDFTFVGQLIRSSQFHLQREKLLVELSKYTNLTIFSPSACFGVIDDAKSVLTVLIYRMMAILRRIGFSNRCLMSFPYIGWLSNSESPSLQAVNPALRPYLQREVYGLKMFQILHDSKIVLNIHADSSPRFASNMRLFEITGVGACMVADWKENLSELFRPDSEVVMYRSSEECLEKVRWLLEHPREQEQIALAAQKRTLASHTFAHRAVDLDRIIRKALR